MTKLPCPSPGVGSSAAVPHAPIPRGVPLNRGTCIADAVASSVIHRQGNSRLADQPLVSLHDCTDIPRDHHEGRQLWRGLGSTHTTCIDISRDMVLTLTRQPHHTITGSCTGTLDPPGKPGRPHADTLPSAAYTPAEK